MTASETVEDYVEVMNEEYTDVERAEITGDGDIVYVEKTRGNNIGLHWTKRMLEYNFAVRSAGGETVKFERIEDGEFVTE